MKLKCNDNRRVMVLPSGNTIHRSDGSRCKSRVTIGGKMVVIDVPYTPTELLVWKIYTEEAGK